ncbi:hypothetical protein SPRG_10203 [Saprolegnia parasitica CBS 223.65]|uniref:Homeobox domain-containing protein n=1 Tax=Saprolegnia parasitica (strain CBS 223.65) TaxID=695850 RepID=A0A067C6C7_SAPPC|nr:hypothetical protein SPRG_10203 [Saprolegnia parasitica CBS 223.65]KDO24670.1 hypothetical protein SPRG_10203 [Saprolegnia parasitica CBS 223.65]|eukprot:XP_012204551.1 hypothetical protein SPRG_10203 [Saprolegnia parasitica CBS 223.65]
MDKLKTTTKLTLDTINTRPVSPTPATEFTTPPRRPSPTPPAHPSQLQLKVSGTACDTWRDAAHMRALEPYISVEKKLTALKIPTACETPLHYTPPPPFPETSPSENKMMDADFGKRKKGTRRGTLNPEAKNVLKAWMFSPEHFAHPYPSEEEKEELAAEAGIEVKQLSNWFTNARKRLWQPVLRQSGVEVKNFLSTGRGGPRGAKLDVPSNITFVAPSSPPTSPRSASVDEDDSFRFNSVPEKLVKRMKREPTDAEASGDSGDSDTWSDARKDVVVKSGFRDLEILAAKSLLGLHREPVH